MAGFKVSERPEHHRYSGMLAERNLVIEPLNNDFILPFSAVDAVDLDYLSLEDAEVKSVGMIKLLQRASRVRHVGSWNSLWGDCGSQPLSGRDPINDNRTSRGSVPHGEPLKRHEQESQITIGVAIARELGRLQDGWAGDNTVAPSSNVIRDLIQMSALLPANTVEPETEVDPEDGSVVLRWMNLGATQSFSLSFFGRGEVAGFLSSQPPTPAWKCKVTDAFALFERLWDPSVTQLITE